jgi:hypothetical protein
MGIILVASQPRLSVLPIWLAFVCFYVLINLFLSLILPTTSLRDFSAMICIHSSRFFPFYDGKREEAENAEMQAASQMSSMASIRLECLSGI